MIKQWSYPNDQYTVVTNQDLLKIKKQKKLTNFGLRTPLSKVPILCDILFWEYKMIQIVNKFLLAGDKFMPEMHLK